MILQEVTPELLSHWREIARRHRKRLSPNAKSAEELIDLLYASYPAKPLKSSVWDKIVSGNVLQNEFYAQKLPEDTAPDIRAFCIQNSAAGHALYQNQDAVFRGQTIYCAFELHTGYFQVEGSSELWDWLCAQRGLDQWDLENDVVVAQYILARERFGLALLSQNAQ